LLYLFLFFTSLYSFFSIGHYGGDGYEEYLTAESIVLDRNFQFHDRPHDPDQLNYKSGVGIEGRNGGTYSARSCLGVAFPLSFFYALGHIVASFLKNIPHDFITILFASFYNPFISAFTVLFVFAISGHLGFKPVTSLMLSLIYGLSTMAPVYTRTGFAEPTLVLFLLISVYWIIRYSKNLEERCLVYSALALAYCVLIKAIGFIFFPCLLVYIFWCIYAKKQNLFDRLKPVAIFAIVFIFGNAIVLAYNYFVYGSILSFGKANPIDISARAAQSTHFIKGAYYYLISPGKGVILFNLPIILSFIGLVKVPKERRKEVVLLLLIFIVNLLFFVKCFSRGSLFSWGPRYLLPSIPFLVLLIGYYYEGYKGFMGRFYVWLLSAVGFFVMLPCMFINQSKFYLFVVEELNLDEYLISFIPDLSPIMGAWWMLVTRIIQNLTGKGIPFNFAPDYWLVKPVSAFMGEYNYIDLWFVKVMEASPSFAPAVYAVLTCLALLSVVSIYKVYVLVDIKENIKQ